MRILLDTHIALWANFESSKLPEPARELLTQRANVVYYSTASVWEVAIKHVKRPDVMHRSFAGFVELCDRVDLTPFP